MPSMKHLVTIAVVALIIIAVVNRVDALKSLVEPK